MSTTNPFARQNQKGFTLLEILVTIIISAILAVILVQVMTSPPWRGYQAIETIDTSQALNSAMENITSDYQNLLTNAAPLVTLQDRVNSAEAGYWAAADGISVAYNQCINEPINAAGHNCQIGDLILKITLSSGVQSLTALFTR